MCFYTPAFYFCYEVIALFIPYERILRCLTDERVFIKCKSRIFYYTLAAPPIGTPFTCNDVKYMTCDVRPFLLTDVHKNVQNITYAELCTTYLLNNAPITVYTLTQCCNWNTVSGQLNSDVLWGTVYTCDDVQVHTRPQDYLIMRLPADCETRYMPAGVEGRIDVAVRSLKDNYAYFLCPIENGTPQTERITHIDTLYVYSNITGCTFDDADTEYVRSVLIKG